KALYLLAAPSTPQEARDEIIERAEAGETVPVAEVNRTIKRAKGRKQRSSKSRNSRSRHVRQAKPADDTGPASASENARKDAEIEELRNAKRQLEIKIAGLESEIEELRAKLATGTGGDMPLSEFDAASKQWQDTFETQRGIIARLENENAKLRA